MGPACPACPERSRGERSRRAEGEKRFPIRHRFIATLRREKLISEKKARQLLGWKHSGFSLDAGDKPVASHDVEGRRRLAEYLLRAPFSLEKITWNETARKVIYRSKRNWHTKRNYEIPEVTDFAPRRRRILLSRIATRRHRAHPAQELSDGALLSRDHVVTWNGTHVAGSTRTSGAAWTRKPDGRARK